MIRLLEKLKPELKIAAIRYLAVAAIIPLSGCASSGLRDRDSDRGAAIVKEDTLGDSFTTIRYLDQGWSESDSLWFYTTTQGSNLLPYDFFLELEQKDKPEPFRSNENINRYRYLPQKPTSSNPDGLPVGFVKDEYKGKGYIGPTCAACHTGQINYRGSGIRIDGGPAGADMETFLKDMVRALNATIENDQTRQRFVKKVLAHGNYAAEDDVIRDLKKYTLRLATYTHVNHSPTDYGYYRLDAFGRIYNRVLEHIISPRQLRMVVHQVLSEDEAKDILKYVDKKDLISSEERDQILERIALLPPMQQARIRHKLYNPANAPVSYPFLWDISQHDYVQWNALASNAGLGPVGRNTGEAIGVFGTLDWEKKKGFSLSSFISGQGWFGTHIKFNSSINVRNLRRLESHLIKLQSPQWPQDIFPAIDPRRAANGERVFNQYCANCHAEIERTDPERRVVAHLSAVSEVGTDPKMATNSVKYMGYSGILRNQYVGTGVGDILINERAPVSALLTKTTLSTVATPDPDKIFLRRWAEWSYDLVSLFFDNEIKPSIKHGNYVADATVNPYASLFSYKARSLNGIWATAPYLHNGSVPTLYDLLLPKKRPGDPSDGEYRPDEFEVGSREFDPVKVGLKSSGYKGFTFKTSLPGNSNAGHEYASGFTPQADGTKLEKLGKEDRLDLLEYLKQL